MRWWGAGVGFESFPATRGTGFPALYGTHLGRFLARRGVGFISTRSNFFLFVFLFYLPQAYELATGLVSGLFDLSLEKESGRKSTLDGRASKALVSYGGSPEFGCLSLGEEKTICIVWHLFGMVDSWSSCRIIRSCCVYNSATVFDGPVGTIKLGDFSDLRIIFPACSFFCGDMKYFELRVRCSVERRACKDIRESIHLPSTCWAQRMSRHNGNLAWPT